MSEELPEAIKELPLEWYIPDDLPCQYATNMVVQHSEHEFIVSFFRASPPIILGPPESVKDQIQGLESVRAECVARVIVSAGRMEGFIESLQTNLDRFRSQVEQE